MRKVILSLVLLLSAQITFSQVAINTTKAPADASAMLDITSTNKGVLIPRLTIAQRDSITSPAVGLLIYQIDSITGFYGYNGTEWLSLSDNLGNHTATKAINIKNFRLYNQNPSTGIRLDTDGTFTLRSTAGQYELARNTMYVDHEGGFYVRGQIGYGIIPISGYGDRMMWHAYKAAFRAGGVEYYEWDEFSTGFYSAAFGYSTEASGNYSFAAGDRAKASGIASVALGFGAKAKGRYSHAFGYNSLAAGYYSNVFGIKNNNYGFASTVVGMYNDPLLTSEQTTATAKTPLFIVGNGVDSVTRSNALVVQRDGRIFVDPSDKNDGTVTSNALAFGTAAVGSGEGIASRRTGGNNQFGLDFYTNYTKRLSVTQIGRVGIGIDNPQAKLDIVGANHWDLNNTEGDVRIGNDLYRLKIGVATAGSGRGGTSIMQYGQPGLYNVLALGSQGSNLLFLNGNSTNVGIGTDNPSQKLTVAGNICATGSIGACSDIRYKTNIFPIANVLTSVMSLNPIYYNWKKEFKDKGFTNDRQLGFSAQEVEKLFPEMVMTDAQGYKAVDYSRMTPVLVEAVKEQQKQIDQQQQTINQQQKDIELLKKQMEELLKKKS